MTSLITDKDSNSGSAACQEAALPVTRKGLWQKNIYWGAYGTTDRNEEPHLRSSAKNRAKLAHEGTLAFPEYPSNAINSDRQLAHSPAATSALGSEGPAGLSSSLFCGHQFTLPSGSASHSGHHWAWWRVTHTSFTRQPRVQGLASYICGGSWPLPLPRVSRAQI